MRRHTGSVLPKIAVTRTADGFRIFAQRENTREDVFALLVLIFFFPLLTAIAILNNVPPLILFIKLAPFVVSLIYVVRRLRVHRKRQGLFGDSHLDVTSWPIRLGEEVSMKFRKHTKAPMDITLVAARVECAELVTLGQGKSLRTERELRWRQDLDDSDWTHSHASGSWKFRMPAHESASVEVRRMKVEWMVTVITSGRDIEKTSEFRLLVIPEVAE